MQQTDMSMFLQSLRGVQPMIFLCYLVIRRAMTVDELQTFTGLSDDAIRPALKNLASKGLLYKQVGEHGRQTWLPVADTFFGQIMQLPLTAEAGSDVVVVVESEGRNNLLSATTTNKPQNPRLAEAGLAGEELLNLAALKAAGILGRKARELAVLPWVTVEYIEGHVQQVKGEFWDNPQGMMIRRIEQEAAFEVPRLTQPAAQKFKPTMKDWMQMGDDDDQGEHDPTCTCLDCKRLHPENYCTYRAPLQNRFSHKEQLSGECGALVVVGHRYCASHLRFEE